MTNQTYVTYISVVLTHIQTVVWELVSETKELIGDTDAGRELLSITLMMLLSIYVAGRFFTYLHHAIAVQYDDHVYTKVLMQKVLALEEQQNKFINDLSKLLTRVDTFDGSCRLTALETRISILERSHLLGVRDVGASFTFQDPFSNDTSVGGFKRSCRKRVRKTAKSEVRECCRNLHGDELNNPSKNKRTLAPKRKLEIAKNLKFVTSPVWSPVKDTSSSEEKTE